MKQFRLLLLVLFAGTILHAQSLTSVSPAVAEKGSEISLRVNGQYTLFLTNPLATRAFIIAQEGTYMLEAKKVTTIDNLTLDVTFAIPNTAPEGAYSLQVFNIKTGNYTLTNALQVSPASVPPQLVAQDVPVVRQNEKLTLKVVGNNTHFITAGSFSYLKARLGADELELTVDSVKTDTLLWASATIPSYFTVGKYDLTLSNLFDGDLQLAQAFEVTTNPDVPVITKVISSTTLTGNTLKLKLVIAPLTTVDPSYMVVKLTDPTLQTTYYATNLSVDKDTVFASVFIPYDASAGFYTIQLQELVANVNIRSNNMLEITTNPNLPSLTAVTPSSGMQGENIVLSITGQNTHFNTTAWMTSVKLINTANADDYIYSSQDPASISDTELQVAFNLRYTNTAARYHLVAENEEEGKMQLSDAFEVLANPLPPKIKLISPTSCNADDGSVIITVIGENTHFKDAGSSLFFYLEKNGESARQHYTITPSIASRINTEVDVEFRFDATITPGIYHIWFQNSTDGKVYKLNAFEIKPPAIVPAITSLTPNTTSIADTVVISVNGSNTLFSTKQCYEIALTHSITGETLYASNIERVSDVLIKGKLNLNYLHPDGSYDIKVQGLSGYSMSKPNVFTITKNTLIKTITPASMLPGDTKTIAVTAENGLFTEAPVQLALRLNGQQWASATAEASSNNQLQASLTLPADAPSGMYSVVVMQTGKHALIAGDALSVGPCPVLPKPGIITGKTEICVPEALATPYSVGVETGAVSYEWQLLPAEAGSITGTSNSANITWNAAFSGAAEVRVRYKNLCSAGEWSDPLAVEVATKPVPLFSAEVSDSQVSLTNSSESASGYLWRLGDGSTSTDVNPVHTFANGNWTIKLIAYNVFCADSTTQSISIKTGLKDVYKPAITLFPNPSDGYFALVWADASATGLAEMVDLSGKVVYTQTLPWQGGMAGIEWPNAKPGNYLLRIYDKNRVVTVLKVIIK